MQLSSFNLVSAKFAEQIFSTIALVDPTHQKLKKSRPDPIQPMDNSGLSVTSWCSIKGDGRINLLWGMEASFDQSYTAI